MLLGTIVWWSLGPIGSRRTLEFGLRARDVERCWVEWSRAGAIENGAWVEARDEKTHVRVAIPARGAREVRLRWTGGGHASLTLENPALVTHGLLWRGEDSLGGEITVAGEDGILVLATAEEWMHAAVEIGAISLAMFVACVLAMWIRGASEVRVEGTRVGPAWWALGLVTGVHVLAAWQMPMLFLGDSMDYAINAITWRQTGSMEPFNAWRLPGYSAMLLPVAGAGWWWVVGVVQGGMNVASAWLAGSLIGRRAGRGWASLGVLVVGLDPVVVHWSRCVMPEAAAMFLVTLVFWLVLRTEREGMTARRLAALAACAGLAAGLCCYLRGNAQIVVVLAPVMIVMIVAREGGWGRGAWVGAIMLACGLGVMSPWLIRNYRETHAWGMTVGSEFTRIQSGWQGHVIDTNQSSVFDPGEVDEMARGRTEGWFGPFEFIARVEQSRLRKRWKELPAWTARESRARSVVDESLARRPDRAWTHRVKAFTTLVGIAPREVEGFGEHDWWTMPWRKGERHWHGNFYNRAEEFRHLDPALTRRVFESGYTAMEEWNEGVRPRVYSAWYETARYARIGISWLAVVGLGWAWRRRDWGMLGMGAVAVAHAGALSVVLLTGTDRYQVSFWGITGVLGVLGISWTVRAVRSRT